MSGALDTLPRLLAANMPVVTREQMREVDRLMIEEFGIQLLQMMENAGLNLAELARLHLDGKPAGRRVVVLAGQGNNGGGGLTAARRLSAWGANVEVVLSAEPQQEIFQSKIAKVMLTSGLRIWRAALPTRNRSAISSLRCVGRPIPSRCALL